MSEVSLVKSVEIQSNKITSEEYFSLSSGLEQHHGVFYKFWQMGRPSLDPNCETCQVNFDPENGQFVDFIFNPGLWKNTTLKEKEFLICHECLHLILEHGKRLIGSKKDISIEDNWAADIVVNHMLTKSFGFDRKEISFADKLCWTDTVFKNICKEDIQSYSYTDKDGKNVVITSQTKIQIPPSDYSYEFYYNLIKQILKQLSFNGATADNHSGFTGKTLSKDIISRICDGLSNEEKQELYDKIKDQLPAKDKNSNQRGTGAGNHWLIVSIEKIKKKKKWETVIKKWAMSKTKIINRDIEQWARLNRRFSIMSTDFFIPSEMEEDSSDVDKLDVYFYLDTSGSCQHLAKRFFTAALSLPNDRFNISLWCFDTQIYAVDPKEKKLQGFGGTSFDIIEEHIQEKIAKKILKKYPTVFIITDGDGNKVKPQRPELWYWFLSENIDYYIPEKSNKFMLSSFE